MASVTRPNLHRELVNLCRRFTGECDTQAHGRLGPVVDRFTPEERKVVVSALRDGRGRRWKVAAECDRATAALASRVLPDAASVDQKIFESSFLRVVLGVADSHLVESRVQFDLLQRAHAIRSVRPGAPGTPSGITVALTTPATLGPLLFGLLPKSVPERGAIEPTVDDLHGVPALRASHRDKSLHLTRLGTSARITISHIRAQDWATAQEYVRSCFTKPLPPSMDLWEIFPDTISDLEGTFLQEYPRPAGPPGLASALLRRLHVFYGCRWFNGWTTGGMWKIAPTGGPPIPQIMLDLLHPLVGLPGRYHIDHLGPDWSGIDSAEHEPTEDGPWPARLVISRDDPPAPQPRATTGA